MVNFEIAAKLVQAKLVHAKLVHAKLDQSSAQLSSAHACASFRDCLRGLYQHLTACDAWAAAFAEGSS